MPSPRKPATLQTVPIGDIVEHPANPRQGDVGAICESIEANGWFGVVTVQRSSGHILDGNHRHRAMSMLGRDKIGVSWVDVDDATALRILLAANRTGDLATYDDPVLADILQSIAANDTLVGTGYDGDDLDNLLADMAFDDEPPEADEPPAPLEKVRKISKPGDVWLLGDHRLMCGDSRDPVQVAALLDGAEINLGFTSPPYADRRKYDEDSGFKPIPPDDYVEWFRPIADTVKTHLAENGSWFVNIKASVEPSGDSSELYVLDLVLAHARDWGWNFATEFCWERIGVPKSVTRRFKNQFEPVYQFAQGQWKMRPDAVRHESSLAIERDGSGRSPNDEDTQGAHGDVFTDRRGEGMAYPGNRIPTFAGSHEATGHAAAFPVGLPQFFIMAYTDEGDNVYDPFTGSGSTILAANNTGRTGYGMELSPAYCDIICNRWQRHTDITPIREKTGKAVDFI
jgi:DNA modification methylase